MDINRKALGNGLTTSCKKSAYSGALKEIAVREYICNKKCGIRATKQLHH